GGGGKTVTSHSCNVRRGRTFRRSVAAFSRWPANATHHPEMLTACSAAIRTLSGRHGLDISSLRGRGFLTHNVFTSIACKFLLLVSGVLPKGIALGVWIGC